MGIRLQRRENDKNECEKKTENEREKSVAIQVKIMLAKMMTNMNLKETICTTPTRILAKNVKKRPIPKSNVHKKNFYSRIALTMIVL